MTRFSPLAEMDCRFLSGVGPKMAERLAKLGVYSVQDILFHLPIRYEDRSRLTPLKSLQAGQSALVEAVILRHEVVRRHKMMLQCYLEDEQGGYLALRFFHFSSAQREQLKKGARMRCYGEVRWGSAGFEMIHPEYEVLQSDEKFPPLDKSLTPVYPTTEGLSQRYWRRLTDQALTLLVREDQLEELLPAVLCESLQFPALKEALHYIHRPPVHVRPERRERSRLSWRDYISATTLPA